MVRKIQLQCIVYRKNNDEIEYLLLRRIPKKGFFWQPPCGGMKKSDKNLLYASLRELKEEINLDKKDIIKIHEKIHHFSYNKHYLTAKPIPKIDEFVYGFEISKSTKIDITKNPSNEHDKFKWVPFNIAIEMLKWKDNKNSLKKLNSILENKDL